jgi:CheY-like chemotaxis protein
MSEPTAAPLRILVVDDDDIQRELLTTLLAMEQFEVASAADGEAALECIHDSAHQPDVILSDIRMPDMDGYALQRRLLENRATCTIPLILMSARADEEGVQCLRKPVDIEQLTAMVQAVTGRSR